MREIKFRKWDFENQEMIDGDSLAFEEYAPISHLLTQKGIMQYTGLKDRNGKEIYEGDILTSEHYPFQEEGKYNYHGVVEWVNEAAAFCITKVLVNSEKRGISDGVSELIEDIEEFEVIGNLFENGELLSDSQDTKAD